MRHKHKHTLEHIFSHPINTNIDWKQIVHLFEALEADIEETSHGRLKVKLNGQENSFAIPHGHSLESKDEIMAIRHFLEAAEVTPETLAEEE